MKALLLFILIGLSTSGVYAKKKVVYKYKKYEELNLDEIRVDGELGSPGEISVSQRYLKKFKNKLPHKPNFNFEMMKGLERVR